MDLSVVIPCRNEAAVIGDQLGALSRQRWDGAWEVVVVDNGSTDDTRAVVGRYQGRVPNLRMIEAAGRLGAAHARNAGVMAARGRMVAFCDADDKVARGWLPAMAQALTTDSLVAARLDFAKLNPPELRKAVKNPQENDLQRVDYPPYLQHASGGTLGVARDVHLAAGGFDEDLPYLEDCDYCFRIQREGIALQFCSDAVVHYRLKDRNRGLFQQSRHWGQYNVLLYKRYRQEMRLEQPWRRHCRRWYSLLRRSPLLGDRQQRYVWIKALGTQVGLLQGALRYGVAPVAGWLWFSSVQMMMSDWAVLMSYLLP